MIRVSFMFRAIYVGEIDHGVQADSYWKRRACCFIKTSGQLIEGRLRCLSIRASMAIEMPFE